MASSRTSTAEGSIVGQIIQSREAGCSELEEESGVLVLEPRFRLSVFGKPLGRRCLEDSTHAVPDGVHELGCTPIFATDAWRAGLGLSTREMIEVRLCPGMRPLAAPPTELGPLWLDGARVSSPASDRLELRAERERKEVRR